tara:strand:+ start:2532 stop:3317 length:786 start_codon:yes stop_codon:yes gene_type:complete
MAKLTPEQLSHFQTFGFLCLRQLFLPQEMISITSEVDELMVAHPGRQSGPSHQSVAPFVELSPDLAWLPEDDRIFLPMEQLLGPGFIWGCSEGVAGSFNESHDHTWHCDRGGQIDLQYTRIKIMIYLQSMRKETGCLRVIPGSQHADFHRSLLPLQEQHVKPGAEIFGVAGSDLCCHALEVDPGDVIVFNHYLFHAVYGKQPLRRYIALKFAEQPTTKEHYDALRVHNQDASRLHESYRRSDRPRVRGMVEKLLEWESELG